MSGQKQRLSSVEVLYVVKGSECMSGLEVGSEGEKLRVTGSVFILDKSISLTLTIHFIQLSVVTREICV